MKVSCTVLTGGNPEVVSKDYLSERGRDGVSDHVGIVESCDGTYVYTVEGNSSDSVRQLSYLVGSYKIMGYGVLVVE